MLFTKVELADGAEMRVTLKMDKIYAKCSYCGTEDLVEPEFLHIVDDWNSDISCGKDECTKELQRLCDERNNRGGGNRQ